MDREAQNRLLTGVGFVAGVVLLFVFFGKRHKGARERFADVTVHDNGTSVSYSPETIEDASIRRRDFVIWRVENQSRERVKVCVQRFKNLGNNQFEDPVEDVEHGHGKCRHVPAGGFRKIRTQVRHSARKGTYKYSIFLNDVEAVDPRLAIVD
jgi:hypothetical protein